MGYYDNLNQGILCHKCLFPMRGGNIGQSKYICTNSRCKISNPHWDEDSKRSKSIFRKKITHFKKHIFQSCFILTFFFIYAYLISLVGSHLIDIWFIFWFFSIPIVLVIIGLIGTILYEFIKTNMC